MEKLFWKCGLKFVKQKADESMKLLLEENAINKKKTYITYIKAFLIFGGI